MKNPFSLLVNKILSEKNISINFVDIGSRNLVVEMESLASLVNVYGFEPNPDEYRKILEKKTDASFLGVKSPNYKSISYSPYAISNIQGVSDFYVTVGPGAAGMLEPDTTRLKEIIWKGDEYKKNFADDIFTVEKVIQVKTNTIEGFAKDNNISYIDYLKIDVEGSEYEVLESAGSLLEKVAVIKAEVCFIPFRKGQKLFSELDLLLRAHGFDLLKYEVVPEQVGLKARTQPWSFYPAVGVPEKYGQPIQADAIYVNRNITVPDRLIAQAAVLIEKHYLDEALYILNKKVQGIDPNLLAALKDYRGDVVTKIFYFFFSSLRSLLHFSRRCKVFFNKIFGA